MPNKFKVTITETMLSVLSACRLPWLDAEGPDGGEAGQGVREVGEDGGPAEALQPLQLAGGAAVEMLEPPVEPQHRQGAEQEQRTLHSAQSVQYYRVTRTGHLQAVDRQGGEADQADQHQPLQAGRQLLV